ncbi:DUF1697 domain-containing protein [Streptomyces sp. NPDC001985]|uniref:DUF1697 domain-containing protein n=1 Tax=Streptomyces sp. NPDC001985 TaxID=3154406 RepID=UPI003332A959
MTTKRYAALLRGINVGGHRKVPMAGLRSLLSDMGYADVATHLQSGNAFFSTPAADEDELAAALGRAIEEHFGFGVDCLVRDGDYLAAVAAGCPFPAAGLEGRQLHVTFLSEDPAPDRLASLDAASFAPEAFRPGDRALYLHTPGGLGRSRLAEALARPDLLRGIIATTRNWNTVTRLVELTRTPV